MLTAISTFVALVAGISIAVERVIEVIKGAVPQLANSWGDKADNYRRALLQLMSVAAGTLIASQIQTQIAAALPKDIGASISWPAFGLIGLMASGGSGLWNHVLDIVQATKEQKEKALTTTAGASVD